jgi:hypothetical protein
VLPSRQLGEPAIGDGWSPSPALRRRGAKSRSASRFLTNPDALVDFHPAEVGDYIRAHGAQFVPTPSTEAQESPLSARPRPTCIDGAPGVDVIIFIGAPVEGRGEANGE